MEKRRWSLNQQAIHHVDVLNWLFGPMQSVFAKSTKSLNKLQAEDTIIVAFETADGVLKFSITTAARPNDYEASIKFCEKGHVQIGGVALNKIQAWNFLSKRKSDNYIKRNILKKLTLVMVIVTALFLLKH